MAKPSLSYPKFICFTTYGDHRNCMRLTEVQRDQAIYFRDAGQYAARVKEIEGKFYCISEYQLLKNKEVRECTRKEWAEDNGKYAPARVPRYRLAKAHSPVIGEAEYQQLKKEWSHET